MSAWWSLFLALFLLPDLGEAERLYREAKYEAAHAQFAAALGEPGVPQGPVLYNMGNCAFRLGRHAEAVLDFRRALLRMPRDVDLRFNLRLAEQKLGIDRPAAEPFMDAVLGLADAFLPAELLWVAVALETVGLLGLVWLGRRAGGRVTATLLLLLGLAAGAKCAQRVWFAGPPTGVVLAKEVAIRSEPRADLPAVLTLKAGEMVRVEEASDRWVRVVHPQGRGWAERAGVGVVE